MDPAFRPVRNENRLSTHREPQANGSFEPHPLLRSAHAQTIAGTLDRAQHGGDVPFHKLEVALPDGDGCVLHDASPRAWKAGDRVAILVHGLCGDHTSNYMQRVSSRLRGRGVRTFLMDLRGVGSSAAISSKLYHSGRSDDLAAAVGAVAWRAPGSPLTLIGFSLGGNIVLKYLAERLYHKMDGPRAHPVARAVAVSPPADLRSSLARLDGGMGAFYNRYFVRLLARIVEDHARLRGAAAALPRTPRTIREFDDLYTAPRNGYTSAIDYYEDCSSAPHLKQIEIPTLVVVSRDDPVVDSTPFETAASPFLKIHLTNHGGHMGFFARRGQDPDRRWMDWRILEFVDAG